MSKYKHEIRDPVHVFVRLDSDERKVLNSRPFQRLRHIHQLALTYLVYPGATHKRFEHSLGVMELAGRVFDIITAQANLHSQIRDIVPVDDELAYWRRVLRMAALCHDIGHLPFSHAAEKELLPEGYSHEKLTASLIRSDEMGDIWSAMKPPLAPEDIVKLGVGPNYVRDVAFSGWEGILADIIVGDAFGVDRMDYLLRDSLHAGVPYGKFDHYRLIDTLRILPKGEGEGDSTEPTLGIEQGGLHTAEALLFARYFMFKQLYCHPVRRIYDCHLKDFLLAWLPEGKYSTELECHLSITDNEVLVALREAARDSKLTGHDPARRIAERAHFRLLYQRNPDDVKINPDAAESVFQAARKKFGDSRVRYDPYKQKGGAPSFPVLAKDGRIVSSTAISDTLAHLPLVAVDYVFIDPECREKAESWLNDNRSGIILPIEEEEEE